MAYTAITHFNLDLIIHMKFIHPDIFPWLEWVYSMKVNLFFSVLKTYSFQAVGIILLYTTCKLTQIISLQAFWGHSSTWGNWYFSHLLPSKISLWGKPRTTNIKWNNVLCRYYFCSPLTLVKQFCNTVQTFSDIKVSLLMRFSLFKHTEGILPEETIIPQIKIEANEFEMKEVGCL